MGWRFIIIIITINKVDGWRGKLDVIAIVEAFVVVVVMDGVALVSVFVFSY